MSTPIYSVAKDRQRDLDKFSGEFTARVPPVPIPNTEVKPLSPDGTACASVWESRKSPDYNRRAVLLLQINPGLLITNWGFVSYWMRFSASCWRKVGYVPLCIDLHRMIIELQAERQRLDEAIDALERLSAGKLRRRGRPPQWLKEPMDRQTGSPDAIEEAPAKKRPS